MKSAIAIPSPSEPCITVVLADGNAFVREGFRTLLNREADLKVVGEARNGRQAVALGTQLRPDLLLFEVANRRGHASL